ncbi:uncharacterized protein LACBIDRAFT_295395 [Laccaria bicolor S238N-H82]|uniref:Predicted protein n=1 Tax=Laccaria bicolor (strain S238N-H82 / ATCC MYA-4686) TaxID=486041 RepID=B0DS68_LACBS|nr:uncharacterized protein LACBIDRAFT_295395 [Laccaria bicolor S238N-H82]EDR02418.1 predicted protein [Laccaria bicolor S238N-H82]|eukprot:XP_001886781.1 predicted protein [Laccaria bicolor S238N-H82]
MAPITVDVCQFDAPGGKMLTQREFTFEFNDGLDLNRLPLDLRPGHYYIITKGDPWRLWKDTNFEIIDHFGVRYYAHAADFYLSIEPQHFVPMEKIVEWGVIIWEKRTRPSIQVIKDTSPSASSAPSERHSGSLSSIIGQPVDAEEGRDEDMAVTTEVPRFIKVKLRHFTSTYGGKLNWLSSKLYTFEFTDGIDLQKLPLDFDDLRDVWIITKGDWQRSWRNIKRLKAPGHPDVIYVAPGLNFFHTTDRFLSTSKILQQRLITWEVGQEPSLLVIRSFDLLALLCDHRRRSILGWVKFSTWSVRSRLHRFVTRAKGPFQLGGMTYGHEPDFSQYMKSQTEGTSLPPAPSP